MYSDNREVPENYIVSGSLKPECTLFYSAYGNISNGSTTPFERKISSTRYCYRIADEIFATGFKLSYILSGTLLINELSAEVTSVFPVESIELGT